MIIFNQPWQRVSVAVKAKKVLDLILVNKYAFFLSRIDKI